MESDRSARSSQSHREWEHAYEMVLLESDNRALFKRIEVAEAAILLRCEDVMFARDHRAERKALAEALANLRFLKRYRLGFDDMQGGPKARRSAVS